MSEVDTGAGVAILIWQMVPVCVFLNISTLSENQAITNTDWQLVIEAFPVNRNY